MTSTHRFRAILAATGIVSIASTFPVRAQVTFPFPPYRNMAYDSSVRVEVTPRDAEVFVDGYYAGVVDDFDGMLQRLRVEPGQHEILLYRDGYRTVRERVYLVRDRTFKIKRQMEALPAGAPPEARPVPPPMPVGAEAPRP